jgi:poly(3-hydroxybutyrate) depolymerase
MRISFLITVSGLVLIPAAFGQNAQKCADLTSATATMVPGSTTLIRSAVLNAAKPAQGNGGATPEHCEVLGAINERTGIYSQHYAIKFHLRMPTTWNSRFFFEGGGGTNGNIGAAMGNLQGQQRTNALALGYAVVSQDSGHDNAVNTDPNRNGGVAFGFDEQARLDFGYHSYDVVTRAAKSLVGNYYGKAPERSYFVGCSEGGREGMMMSQRFPDYFDGILACAPGFNLPKAALFGHSWDVQTLSGVAKATGVYDRFGEPLLNKTFTDEDLDLAAQAILSACDALDGLADGVIDNFTGCTTEVVAPKMAAITCKGPKRNNCISAAQVAALQKLYAGARNSKGELLYSDWAWDRGIAGKIGETYNQGWRMWKMGQYDVPANSGIIETMGSSAASGLFVTPPVQVAATGAAPVAYLMSVDFEKDPAKLDAKSGEYTEPVSAFMMASSTDLSAFKARGGKLVIVQGVSDPVFSIQDTIRWWNTVNRNNNSTASDFVRLFAVPGMNHCGGGPSTDQFDAFSAMVNWVEKSSAPDKIVATAGAASPWPGRTRPLCVYPQQSRYQGTGNVEDASNFVCRLP